MDAIFFALQSTPPALLILGALWLLVMISVPIIRWTLGEGAERVGISLGVLMQFGVSFVVAAQLFGLPIALLLAVFVMVSGWAVEFLESRTGFPFGPYHYTDVLKPQLGRVPLLIPLAWFMMMPPSWMGALFVMDSLGLGWHPALFALLSGTLFTFWDFFLDPQMVRWNFWQWKKPRGYFGIPWTNYAGWYVVGFLLSLGCAFVLEQVYPGGAGLSTLYSLLQGGQILGSMVLGLGIYALTAILQFIGQFFFWNQKGPAIVGLLLMGSAVAVALVGLV